MAKTINFQKFRDSMDAEKYRLLQATAVLELFRRANDGRDATDTEELGAWAAKNLSNQKVDPFKVLSKEQIRDFLLDSTATKQRKIEGEAGSKQERIAILESLFIVVLERMNTDARFADAVALRFVQSVASLLPSDTAPVEDQLDEGQLQVLMLGAVYETMKDQKP